MGKSHKTGGHHNSKKPDSAKKKDKEKDKSAKEKKTVAAVKGTGEGEKASNKHNKQHNQKSPKSAKKKGGDGKSDKSKKDKQSHKHKSKPKSGKEKGEKSGKEKTTKHSSKAPPPPPPPAPKKEDPVEGESTTSSAEEADVELVELATPKPKPPVIKGSPKKAVVVVEVSEAADSCESKKSSAGQQTQKSSAEAASSAEEPETNTGEQQATSNAASSEEATSDDEQQQPKADKKDKHQQQQHKSKPPKKEDKKPPKSTKNASPPKLEFTKPTINQMVREEERQKHPKPPLVDTPLITRYEFEAFNDEMEEMNSGLQMLRSSYGSIITSLVAMYTKRGKRGQKTQLPPTVDGKANLLTPINGAAGADVQEEASILNDADKYNIENFINPATRQASFDALFAEVELLNRKTEKFRSAFFDKKGYFLQEKYDGQKEMKLSRKKLNHFWLWTRKLTEVIDEIARNYNDDLLNMFRLH